VGGVVPVPDDVSLETAALISCGVATGIGAVLNAAHVQPGTSAAVFGCGGVGLNIIQGAKLAGANLIAAIDRVPAKLGTAQRFGASHTLDAANPEIDVVKALRDLTGGRGVDYAFEAIGHTGILQTALSSTRKGGIVIAVGLPPVDQRLDVRGLSLVLHEKSIIGSLYGSMSPGDQIPQLLGLYRESKLMLDELISHRFSLDQINDAFDMLQRGEMNRGLIIFDAA
jgi:Zn-dependent alcohol dehydrogenase